MSNVGRWATWYTPEAAALGPQAMDGTETMQVGAEWLAGCTLVEDWGCGWGGLREFVPSARYRGVDGTQSGFADEVVDLETYRSDVDGLFMRAVLEHNRGWATVLDNAVASFRKRMVLILFTPMADVTGEIGPDNRARGVDVPNISFRHEDLTARFAGCSHTFADHGAVSFYGTERVYLLEKLAS